MNLASVAETHAIYDVLVRECGAPEKMRSYFHIALTNERQSFGNLLEYRFIGALGFGGKYRESRDRWYVDCYPEDETPERLAMIERANAALAELEGETGGGKGLTTP